MTQLTGAFSLRASSGDVAHLRATAAALEDEVLAHYEEFLYYEDQRVDETKWKLLKTDDLVQTFVERRKRGGTGISSPTSPATACELEPQASLAAQSSIGRALTTGVITGRLDDALFGCSFQDTASLRYHDACLRGQRGDAAVLLKIDGAIKNDPYRFFGVTWHIHNPLLAKTRDCLLLQHVHETTLRSGERVGVSLRHSIEHPDISQLRGISATRVTISSVTFYRQVGTERLEMFGIEFLDEKRHAPHVVHRHEVARDLLLSTKACDLGFQRKLGWLLQQKHVEPFVEMLPLPGTDHRHCSLCAKTTRSGPFFSVASSTCTFCATHVCSGCTVSYEIQHDVSMHKSVRVCIQCVLLVRRVPTFEVAQSQVS